MPIFTPVTTSAPPERRPAQLLAVYWRTANDIARHDGRSSFSVMARILYGRLRYGFGAELYDLYRFNRKPLSSYRDLLSTEERDALLASVDPLEHRNLCVSKLDFYEHCLVHGLATPKVFGLIRKSPHDPVLKTTVHSASDGDSLARLLAKIPDGSYVLKPVDAAHGWGVALVAISGGHVFTTSGQEVNPHDLFAECAAQAYTQQGFLIQEYLTAHRDLLPLMPGPGLGSFRIVTFVQPGPSVNVWYAEVKIPGEGKITSNFSGGEGGSFLCRIDIASGKIIEAIGATQQVPITAVISHHPTTGIQLEGRQIPCWPDAMALVRRAALAFGKLKSLGWDVAITDRGPMLLETNFGYAHDSMEITLNRGIRDEFRALIASTG